MIYTYTIQAWVNVNEIPNWNCKGSANVHTFFLFCPCSLSLSLILWITLYIIISIVCCVFSYSYTHTTKSIHECCLVQVKHPVNAVQHDKRTTFQNDFISNRYSAAIVSLFFIIIVFLLNVFDLTFWHIQLRFEKKKKRLYEYVYDVIYTTKTMIEIDIFKSCVILIWSVPASRFSAMAFPITSVFLFVCICVKWRKRRQVLLLQCKQRNRRMKEKKQQMRCENPNLRWRQRQRYKKPSLKICLHLNIHTYKRIEFRYI